jgi:hypothetical protein
MASAGAAAASAVEASAAACTARVVLGKRREERRTLAKGRAGPLQQPAGGRQHRVRCDERGCDDRVHASVLCSRRHVLQLLSVVRRGVTNAEGLEECIE